jgi:hypothetical protein
MLQPNEIYLNGNNSTVQIASAHETSKTFSYNGNEVLFDIKDDVMVNATQLAKIYGKRPNDYLSLPATNQLINAITRKYGISENQLVISKAGSSHNGGGTWMHEDVALEFLSTLSAVRIIPLTGLVDKAFKKILFSFGSLRNYCTFVVPNNSKVFFLRRARLSLTILDGLFLCQIACMKIHGCLSCVIFPLRRKSYYCLATREMAAVFLSIIIMPNNSKYGKFNSKSKRYDLP